MAAALQLPREVMEGPILLLANPSAGGGPRAFEEAVTALEGHGLRVELWAGCGGEVAERARRLAGEVPRVLVAGGDGTLTGAAEGLAGSATALAVLPTGTLNHFARRLGIEDPPAAARTLARGRTRRIAVGRVGDRVFLNTATFGHYAGVLRLRERLERWLGRWPAAGVAVLATAARLRPLDLRLELDGRVLERTTPLVWVGLGPGSFPFPHEAGASADEPQLEVAVLRSRGRAGLIAFLARFLVRLAGREGPREDRALELLRCRSFRLDGPSTIGITRDGEIDHHRPPFEVTAEPGALTVVVP